MTNKSILEQLFDEKKLKILRLFYSGKKEEFYLREISKKTGVPVATTFRITNRLAELGIIEQMEIKKFKLYKLKDSKQTKFLEKILDD